MDPEPLLIVVEAPAAGMLLRASANGMIGLIAPELGEAVIPGETVVTLLPDDGTWFGFDPREDVSGVAIGAQVSVAAQAAATSGRMLEICSWGGFATWRAARASGYPDLNTFFLCIGPTEPSDAPPPGQNHVVGSANTSVKS